MFKCQMLEGGSIAVDGDKIALENGSIQRLVEDYSVICYQGDHIGYSVVGIVFLIVFVIGIPFTIFIVMKKNHKHLHDEKSEHHHMIHAALGGLYVQYHPEYWWFELVILFNKTMMCGGLVVLAPGTPIQILCAILIMLFHLLVVLKLAPYIKVSEDWSCFATTLGLFLISLGAYSMKLKLKPTSKFFVDVLTTTIPFVCIVVVIGITVFLDCGLLEMCRRRCGCGDQGKGDKSSKVHPSLSRHETHKFVRSERDKNETRSWL